MSKTLEMTVQKREITGKKVAGLRRQGLIVANIFSKGKESTTIQVEYEKMRKMVEHAGYNHPINLTVEGGEEHLVLIKDIDRDPRNNRLQHIAFHEVRRDQKVEAEVPVHLTGTSPAVLAGNIIVTIDNTILVEANPLTLPGHLDADASMLVEPDDNIQAKDLKLPAGVILADDPEKVVYKVEVPRSQVEEDAEQVSEEDAVAATLEASGDEKPAEG
jgi:large subunit ribosomal protein L25